MSSRSHPAVIRLRGVQQNNLKGIDLDLPLNQLVLITGLSGSGKSSLAFDTLYAEGQRRYIETFSPYARQFFDRMDKPQVKEILGVPPAIAIEQKNTVKTTRSTVGTMTEICDFMKLLWPHVAQLHCRRCGQPVSKDTPAQIWQAMPSAGELVVSFELALSEKLSLAETLALTQKQGYQRLIIDGAFVRTEEALIQLERNGARNLRVVQDRVSIKFGVRRRFIEACEQAYHFGKGRLMVFVGDLQEANLRRFSAHLHCAACDLEYREPSSALFSFNHPLGACPECRGFGRIITIDYHRALPDRSLSIREGAIKPWQTGHGQECQKDLERFCRREKVPMNVPFRDLSDAQQRWVIEGDRAYGQDAEHEWPRVWYGIKGYFRWLESKAYKMHVRVLLSRYRSYTTCPVCRGQRLQEDALLFRLPDGLSLADFYRLTVDQALEIVRGLSRSLAKRQRKPLVEVFQEVSNRLDYLAQVGLGYLTLDRPTRTLSGGETERVNLTRCVGTRLVNTLYVLDEPSVGLHVRDTARLVRILEELRDLGNTVVVVEHEPGIIEAADYIVDLGPAQGERGGEVVFAGKARDLLRHPTSLTAQYLNGTREIQLPERRPVKPKRGAWIRLESVSRHNLQALSVQLPLERFVSITGVSGSGKTTLIREVVHPMLVEALGVDSSRADSEEGESDGSAETSGTAKLSGWESLGGVVLVDQSPVGKTPRSTPALFIGAFDDLRKLFAQSESARQRGMNASAFSFNSAQGQCERCRGAGFEKIEMQFLSDVFIRCSDCDGKRYRAHVLEVKIQPPKRTKRKDAVEGRRGKERAKSGVAWTIADCLAATVDEAVGFLGLFGEDRAAQRAVAALGRLQDVGLGYLRLGQPVNTLSGGENQRLKLARHLAEFTRSERREQRPTLFLFDEPTTGLHFADIDVLLGAFQRLVNAGHSVWVVEHNLEVIKCSDWVIDLGPEAGAGGGQVVAQGTPEAVAACRGSHTGKALKAYGLAKPRVTRATPGGRRKRS